MLGMKVPKVLPHCSGGFMGVQAASLVVAPAGSAVAAAAAAVAAQKQKSFVAESCNRHR